MAETYKYQEIVDAVNEYIAYSKANGLDENVCNCFVEVSKAAYQRYTHGISENNRDLFLRVTTLAKKVIRQYIIQECDGTFEQLEDYAQENKQSYDIIDKYYEILKFEGTILLDSYCLYVEKNRPKRERFYEPRRKTLKQVADAIQDLEDDKLDELFLHMPPRVGKLLADNTPVFTSEGWKTHGELKVGDMVVGLDGNFIKVLAVHPKHHTTHTVTLSNGEQIKCHANHEWTVYDRSKNAFVTLETKEMMGREKTPNKKNGVVSMRNRFLLPIHSLMEGEWKDLPVEPYVLGAWLGDGTNTKPWITDPESDRAIINKIERLGYPVEKEYTHKTTGVISFNFGKKLKDDLNKLGMCYYGKRTQKHIPTEYITARADQRLQLLAGLIDTDGTFIQKENRYSFSTTEEALRDGVLDLINSFGWRACVTEHNPKTSSSGIVGRKKVYCISFNPTEHIPCALSRKKIYEFSEQRRIAIEKIEESEPESGNCITVDSPDGLYLVGKTMQPTHNSQLVTMATAWHISRNHELSNLYITYKESLGGAFLDGVMEILTDPTYCHMDVFPDTAIVYTDAKNHKIDLHRRKKYKTLSGKGLESGLNGEYDAKGWMIVDDPLEGIQDVLNSDTLKRKQIVFDNNVMSRKKEKCKVLHIGTIWSLHDLFSTRLDFLQNNPKAGHVRIKVIKIPALNENDESNFNYDYDLGFSTEYYQALRAKFEDNDDLASWYAQYQQEPIERDGAVFVSEHMRFYNGILPTEGLYRICAACDVALGGEDFLSFPVAYMFEDSSVYIHDVVFDNSEKKYTKPQVIEKIIEHNIGSAFFEANQGGEGYKDEIDTELQSKGIKINMRSEYAPSNKRKEQRIWDKAGSIREWYFRDTGHRDKQYRMFMTNLYSFSMQNHSKHKHEDAADSLATLAYFIEGTWQNAKVEAIVNPFRRGRYGY